MTLAHHNEQLTLEKNQLAQIAESRLGLLGVLALQHGKRKAGGKIEYRLSKAAINQIDGRGVSMQTLKSGVIVITVTPVEDE